MKYSVMIMVLSLPASAAEVDSVGVETKHGQQFIIHEVESGDTPFALSRHYKVKVEDLAKHNAGIERGITIGQRLLVPVFEGDGNKTAEKKDSIHAVQAGETLFAISRLYKVDLDEIKALNRLNSSALSIGQRLIIPKQKTTQTAGIKTDTLSISPNSEIRSKTEADQAAQAEPIVLSTNDKPFRKREVNIGGIDMVEENGFAMKIPKTEGSRKFLVLHRYAPLGTIIEVTNEMNGESIFARVVGRLPETGINRGVLIRLTDAAYSKLQTPDAKMPVEIRFAGGSEP